MSNDYKSPDGSHRHKCYSCGFVWEHSDDRDTPVLSSRTQVLHDYHECPGCRRCNWANGIYNGPEQPTQLGEQPS